MAPVLDLFVTLLSMGRRRWREKLAARKALLPAFRARLAEVMARHGEKVLDTPHNTISMALTLDSLRMRIPPGEDGREPDDVGPPDADAPPPGPSGAGPRDGGGWNGGHPTYLGAMLFRRCVSGCRIVAPGAHKTIGTHTFTGYGASCDGYPHVYMTAACSIATRPEDLELFCKRLEKTLTTYKERQAKYAQKRLASDAPPPGAPQA
jgi:O-phospho-L-seryl-tRNASec:L-selenocysteinyl-tRNA synthase